MLRSARLVLGFACLVLAPSLAFSQATITGVVRDASGAVLPGVTVEAASPVLIEKVRSATTDSSGGTPHRSPSGLLRRVVPAHRLQHGSP